MKSFHTPMNVKMAMVAREGFTSGIMISHQVRIGPQPSILAASSKSLGIPLKSGCSKKTLKAEAKKLQAQRGVSVLYQPSQRTMRKKGIIVTWAGIIMV